MKVDYDDCAYIDSGIPTPPEDGGMITEGSDFMLTESGEFMIIE